MPKDLDLTAVLIEGVECAGKTTLIRALRENLPLDCKALSHQPGHQFDRFIREYVLGHNLVFNRGHFSEFVYSRLWGRDTPFSASECEVLTEYAKRHFVLVHCSADAETLRTRYERRNYQQRARIEELTRICELFDEAFQTVPHLRYVSTDTHALAAMVEQIQEGLRT